MRVERVGGGGTHKPSECPVKTFWYLQLSHTVSSNSFPNQTLLFLHRLMCVSQHSPSAAEHSLIYFGGVEEKFPL